MSYFHGRIDRPLAYAEKFRGGGGESAGSYFKDESRFRGHPPPPSAYTSGIDHCDTRKFDAHIFRERADEEIARKFQEEIDRENEEQERRRKAAENRDKVRPDVTMRIIVFCYF